MTTSCADTDQLPLLYCSHGLVAVNKPSGMLVHRSALAADADTFVVQRLRDQLGQHVYPVHRLDRPTSGVLLFALDSALAAEMAGRFATHQVGKRYLAIVRGWLAAPVDLDHPLKVLWDPYGDRGKRPDKPPQPARTCFRSLAQAELPVSLGRYPLSRYALVEARPHSGRKHQIRRHLKHLAHPIIGDVKYGKGEHNRYFRERWGIEHLLLHASRLEFEHPVLEEVVRIEAPLRDEFNRVVQAVGWQEALEHE